MEEDQHIGLGHICSKCGTSQCPAEWVNRVRVTTAWIGCNANDAHQGDQRQGQICWKPTHFCWIYYNCVWFHIQLIIVINVAQKTTRRTPDGHGTEDDYRRLMMVWVWFGWIGWVGWGGCFASLVWRIVPYSALQTVVIDSDVPGIGYPGIESCTRITNQFSPLIYKSIAFALSQNLNGSNGSTEWD